MASSTGIERAGDRVRLGDRLWRMRRRRDHIDATLRRDGASWTLQFFRNDRRLLIWSYDDEAAARAEADSRRRALDRAGWTEHW